MELSDPRMLLASPPSRCIFSHLLPNCHLLLSPPPAKRWNEPKFSSAAHNRRVPDLTNHVSKQKCTRKSLICSSRTLKPCRSENVRTHHHKSASEYRKNWFPTSQKTQPVSIKNIDQLVNAVLVNNCYLLLEWNETRKYSVWAKCRVFECQRRYSAELTCN